MAQMDGLLRYHFKVDTDLLDDEKYCELEAKLSWILENHKQ